MADFSDLDPNLGTREEDWPELDVDSDTEEGAEASRRADAVLLATIDRSIRKRKREQERHEQLINRGIPEYLYDKAEKHQDRLTDDERHLLLNRGDVVGKALAQPESLTMEEIHQLLRWPPPDVVRANIERATGGELSTPAQLYAKAKDAIANPQLGDASNSDEIVLLGRSFYAPGDPDFTSSARMAGLGRPGPGTNQAMNLAYSRLGFEFPVLKAAMIYTMNRMMQK